MTRTPSPTRRRELHMALAEARLNGLEQYQIAGRAGVDPATLSRILNGKREPTADQARAIASALNRPLGQLFPELEATP